MGGYSKRVLLNKGGVKMDSLVPYSENRCIWMVAGIVAYKLCDRDYNCNECPFDQAMGNEFAEEKEEQVEEESPPSMNIETHTFYHPCHTWLRIEKGEKVVAGIDNFLSRFISKIKTLVLPKTGDFFHSGEFFAHIIEERGIIPLPSPVNSFIQTVNPCIKKNPYLLSHDPMGEGWLFKIKPEKLEQDLKGLLFGKDAIEWYRKEEKRLISTLSSIMDKTNETLGPTLQDGGERIFPLLDSLPSSHYNRLIQTFFTRSKH
jgi:glycine cleavage system H protein